MWLVNCFPVQPNLTAAQVGVTWWCGTVAQWACPGTGAGLCLRPGVMQLFIQPLLHSRSFSGYWICQQRASSCSRRRNQRLLISQRNPKPTTEQAFWKDRDVSHTSFSPWVKTEGSSDTSQVSISQVEHAFLRSCTVASEFGKQCQPWSSGRFFPRRLRKANGRYICWTFSYIETKVSFLSYLSSSFWIQQFSFCFWWWWWENTNTEATVQGRVAGSSCEKRRSLSNSEQMARCSVLCLLNSLCLLVHRTAESVRLNRSFTPGCGETFSQSNVCSPKLNQYF